MALILKLKDGGASTYYNDLSLVNEYRSREDADPNIIAQIDRLFESGRLLAINDELTKNELAKLEKNLTSRAAAIIKNSLGLGATLYDPNNSEVATRNSFGRYNKKAIDILGNELERRSINPDNSETVTISVPGNSIYVYNGVNWGNYDLTSVQDTTMDRIKDVATLLNTSLNKLNSSWGKGYTYTGVNELDKAIYQDSLEKVLELLILIENGTITEDAAFKQLKDLLLKTGIDDTGKSTFRNLFASYYNTESGTPESSTATTAATAASDRRYLTTEEDGTRFIYNTDPTLDNYKTVEIVKSDGTKTVFDLSNPEDIDKVVNLGFWDKILNDIRAINASHYKVSDFSSQGFGKGIDFSNFFTGDDVYFVDLGDFDFEHSLWLPYDKWFTNWDTLKSNFKYYGNTDVDPEGLDVENQYVKLFNLDPEFSLDLTVPEFDESTATTYFGGTKDTNGDINGSGFLHKDTHVTEMLTSEDPKILSLSLDNKIKLFVKLYLLKDFNTLNNIFPNNTNTYDDQEIGDLFMQLLIENRPEIFKSILNSLYTDRSLSPDSRTAIRELYKALTKLTPTSLKLGGVLKYAKGGASATDLVTKSEGTTNVLQTSYNNPSSKESLERAKENQEPFKFKTEDALRILSLAADIGGIASSNAVGWGTVGAAVLGLGSTALDWWADSVDKNVTDNARKANLAMGLGSTAVGLIPDAKALTTGRKALKTIAGIARRAGGFASLLGAYGLAKEDIKALEDMSNDPNRQFNGDDLKLILNTARLLATVILTKRTSNVHRNKSAAVTTPTRTVGGMGKNNEVVDVPLTKAQFDKIVETGKTLGKAAADLMFRNMSNGKLADDAEFPVNFGDNGFTRFGYNVAHGAGRIIPGVAGSTSYVGTGKLNFNSDVEPMPGIGFSTWGKPGSSTSSLPLGWFGRFMNPKPSWGSSTVPTQGSVTVVHPRLSSNHRDGGKLEKLNQFIKNK